MGDAASFDWHNLKGWPTASGIHKIQWGSTLPEGSLGSINLGKVTPATDGNGQGQLIELYDRQIYLSHLQARALYDALGRSLGSLMRAGRQAQGLQTVNRLEEDREDS
jgi:hypothetical protein